MSYKNIYPNTSCMLPLLFSKLRCCLASTTWQYECNDQHGIYTRITKMSDKAFVDEFTGRMGVYIKTYFKKTKSGGTEVAKYSTRMDPVTINEYYVNGKRTTKKLIRKK